MIYMYVLSCIYADPNLRFVIFLIVILLIVLIGYISESGSQKDLTLVKRSKYSIDKRRHPEDIEGGPPTLREVTGSVLHRGHPHAEYTSNGMVLNTGPSLLEERRRNREAARRSRQWNRMYDGDVEGDIELPTYSA